MKEKIKRLRAWVVATERENPAKFYLAGAALSPLLMAGLVLGLLGGLCVFLLIMPVAMIRDLAEDSGGHDPF